MTDRPTWCATFLAALEHERGRVVVACRVAGVSRSRAYELRAADEGFAAAWDAAQRRAEERQRDAYLAAIRTTFP